MKPRFVAMLAAIATFTLLGAPAPSLASGATAPTKRCGSIEPPYGSLLVLTARGTSCRSARNLIRSYYRKARRGDCVGNSCVTTVRGYRCATHTAGAEKATGVSTTCTRGRRRVQTLTALGDGITEFTMSRIPWAGA